MDTAIALYGPPAAGKDTVTAALAKTDNKFRHYQRMKVGTGRTTGYRMASSADLNNLVTAGEVIYSNSRYDSTYVIDQPELNRMLGADQIPVLHVGQPEAIEALLNVAPAVRWVIVELWCPRDVAAGRAAARGTDDLDERLAAWDATTRLTVADARIDTASVSPAEAAGLIVKAVRAAQSSIVVPTMHLVHPDGSLDLAATHRHAIAAGAGWVDHFLINGSTTAGGDLSSSERSAVLDVWLEAVLPGRLLACTWSTEDIAAAGERHIRPMAVLQANNRSAAEQLLRHLPTGSTIYSHPMFGSTFDADLAAWARREGHLPSGGKLAKVSLDEIAEIRHAAPAFATWDGSSRRIRDSVGAGAAGVVATPLAAALTSLPPRSIAHVQEAIDLTQAQLDQFPERADKRRWLLEQIHA